MRISILRGMLAASVLTAAALPLESVETALVEYDIDGTAKYANVTWNLGAGNTEQKQIKFPVHESFRAPIGSLAYISAQKARVTRPDPVGTQGEIEVQSDGVHGTVHVVIHINFKTASEATADAPYGIAKASAKVE
jgi:hypothetical protein